MKRIKVIILLMVMLVMAGMQGVACMAENLTCDDIYAQRKPVVRVWPSQDRRSLNIEIDSIERKRPSKARFNVKVRVLTPGSTQVLMPMKTFHVKCRNDENPYSLKLSLPKEVLEWSLNAPLVYKVIVGVYRSLEGGEHFMAQYTEEVSFQGTIEEDPNRKVLAETGLYAGYDKLPPAGDVDYRARMYRNAGYIQVRDLDYTSSNRMARLCASLGMLYEPLMSEYKSSGNPEPYLEEVSRWAKERAGCASVYRWLLPAMPDSVAQMCRQRIASIDPRPVLMYNDASLRPADDPMPEFSLAEPPASKDTIQEVAEASILKGAPGVKYLHRVNCGGPEVTDSNGNVWAADTMKTNTAQHTDAQILVGVAGELKQLPAADQPVMQQYRLCTTNDNMTYRFPVDSLGSYCVEIFVQEPIVTRNGGRMFNIMINGSVTNLIEPRALTAGKRNVAVKLAFAIITQDKDYIEIKFPKPYAGHAIVSAIAIGSNN